MDAERFVAVLAERDLLSASQIEALRKRIAQSAQSVSGATVAEWLIEDGQLTRPLAERLLGVLPEARAQSPAQPTARFPAQPRPADRQPADEPSARGPARASGDGGRVQDARVGTRVRLSFAPADSRIGMALSGESGDATFAGGRAVSGSI